MTDENRWDEKAGLLYLLCFEHVDNLGAYSIPSETGLLIPSGYIKNLISSEICVCYGGLPAQVN